MQKFDAYGLKKVIATHYAKSDDNGGKSYKIEFSGAEKGVVKTKLEGNGDFRSEECINILRSADIVVTNPPFSLFREYLNQLISYNKKFLIMGNNNAITYKEVFLLIKGNKMWLGNSSNKTMEFQLAPHYSKWDRLDENGKKYGKVPAISWFTNLPHKKRNEELFLFKTYAGNEAEYPKYDNYDAIEVSKVVNIPVDYEGAMGVPITFLDKFNPNQFDIVGMSSSAGYNADVVGLPLLLKGDARPLINSKNTYARVFIKAKKV